MVGKGKKRRIFRFRGDLEKITNITSEKSSILSETVELCKNKNYNLTAYGDNGLLNYEYCNQIVPNSVREVAESMRGLRKD